MLVVLPDMENSYGIEISSQPALEKSLKQVGEYDILKTKVQLCNLKWIWAFVSRLGEARRFLRKN